MKQYSTIQRLFTKRGFLTMAILVCMLPGKVIAQDSAVVVPTTKKIKLTKNTFEGVWLMDNQTVMVPVKGTLEMDIQHRFGTMNNGAKDLFGLFAPSNIRLGISYSPVSKLYLGVGLTKERMQVDLNAKYSILQQTVNNKIPVSIAFFGNLVIDTRDKSNFRYAAHRLSYFSQLIIARKITKWLSVQVSPDFSWFNNIEGYVDSKGEIQKKMHNGHLAISGLIRAKFSAKSAIIAGLDQPLTQHPTNNPNPNICFGFETTTSSHSFQVFAGNYYGIVPQSNNVFNHNDYKKGQFVIGFNITHLWNF